MADIKKTTEDFKCLKILQTEAFIKHFVIQKTQKKLDFLFIYGFEGVEIQITYTTKNKLKYGISITLDREEIHNIRKFIPYPLRLACSQFDKI